MRCQDCQKKFEEEKNEFTIEFGGYKLLEYGFNHNKEKGVLVLQVSKKAYASFLKHEEFVKENDLTWQLFVEKD